MFDDEDLFDRDAKELLVDRIIDAAIALLVGAVITSCIWAMML